jgi:1-deoxyxylulose-5-phosphate synthase
MKYRYLGNSGLAVSKIGLGTATFGQKDWGSDEKESTEILDVYSDLGGNFIDTADK